MIAIIAAGAVVSVGIALTENSIIADDSSICLTPEDNNSNVSLNVGDTVNLTLKDYGDGGYVWEIIEVDEQILNLTKRTDWGIPSDVVGNFGYDTWIFTAKNSGTTTLKLACYRLWGGIENATMSFTAYVVVK